jgi:hypothetical protein
MPNRCKTEDSTVRRVRAYLRPVLARGPVLTQVTAQAPVSGLQGGCWIARAAFGEQDLRWMIFREWLFGDAPAWFRNFYLRHGEAIGSWLKDHARARAVVRVAMTPAIRRVLQA